MAVMSKMELLPASATYVFCSMIVIFSAFFIAKKKHTTMTETTSQAKGKDMTSATVETIDVDMMDYIHANGMIPHQCT
jgi:hypothetical protein